MVEPVDVSLRLEWMPHEGRVCVREATYRALPMGESVRLASINKFAIGTLLHEALESEFLGSGGWPGLVADHADCSQVQIDALVYLLAVALDSPKPSATVAIARGMSPASGPSASPTPGRPD